MKTIRYGNGFYELTCSADARGKVSSRRNGERGYAPCEKLSDLKKIKTKNLIATGEFCIVVSAFSE